MLTIMRDYGINKGLVQEFQTSNRRSKGVFYGFRKMFWYYLTKLGVAFYDPCCETAGTENFAPVHYNLAEGVMEVMIDGTWTDITAFTTTTTTSTTTTTTAAPTTTTTTTAP